LIQRGACYLRVSTNDQLEFSPDAQLRAIKTYLDTERAMELNINYKVELDNECIDDIMATALEGGITYWCDAAEVVGDYLGEYASEQISRGGTLKLHDSEEDETYELTLDKFLAGLAKAIGEGGLDVLHEGKIDPSSIDAEDADVIIQYAIFGEVVYG